MEAHETLVKRLLDRAIEAGYPKSELYNEAALRIEQLERELLNMTNLYEDYDDTKDA